MQKHKVTYAVEALSQIQAGATSRDCYSTDGEAGLE